MPDVPDAWEFTLLALGTFRLYRLIARDTITEPIRETLTYPDAEAVTLTPDEAREALGFPDAKPRGWRPYLSTLLRCPWCLGMWLAAAAYAAWALTGDWALAVASVLALSGVVALIAKVDA